MAKTKNVLKINTNAEFLSFMINKMPGLDDLDLPVQGKSTKPYGKLILDSDRYKNAFCNAINIIGLTIIKRNAWENPWESFANRGTLKYGQQVREMVVDLAKKFDYNEEFNNTLKFTEVTVPNILNYIHEINFQKVYTTSISDDEITMAFDSEDGILELEYSVMETLFTTYNYDRYLIDKYMLCRRAVDGTIPVVQITETEPRKILSAMKGVSNKMTFMKPTYNPAGLRRATSYDDQRLILDADREAINSTEILSVSYFKEEADAKSKFAMIDDFSETDEKELTELIGDQFIPFTEDEKAQLKNVLGVIITDQWFMDFYRQLSNSGEKGTKSTEFDNPTTLVKNLFLHAQMVCSTSPFENCALFVEGTPSVVSVSITPSSATVNVGQTLQLTANVITQNFANKSVVWSVEEADTIGEDDPHASINQKGILTIPNDYTGESLTVKATSIYDNTKVATATITIAGNNTIGG